MPEKRIDAQPLPAPRSVEELLEHSRNLRAEADRLEQQAEALRNAIHKDRRDDKQKESTREPDAGRSGSGL